jgi:1,2-dihydroxy-3-keto-5-methylthiopentene dioxygenase
MAVVNIPAQDRRITDADKINAFLNPFGIFYEHWGVEGRIREDATDQQILEAYASEIERVKKAGAYTTVDVINVTPETPGLDALCDRFNKEHIHTEDEVRFCVKGRGLFHIHPAGTEGAPVFSVELDAGDMINVPKGTQHWFDLCKERNIKAIRFFQDKSGWTPHYVDNGVHTEYAPLCWGPAYIPSKSVTLNTV